ncbi:alpha/beta-hydrolase [Polyplosphaeria fusca]|uniref:Alpha/beta-hydrolase n=1 Tax=Polyplosphaeria fusca TaxID=682080 RepID=A0A9P4R0H7_9PLEO|nr:alpha/beta-hydrolase [Polyplosphaeria fusca]
MFAMTRTQLGLSSLAQDRFASVPTTTAYLNYAKQHGFVPESITLPSGTKAHWIGNKNAQKVILYFHGGGYVVSLVPAHFDYLAEIKDALVAQGSDTAVLFLAYDLAPEHPYPTQLRQGVEVLRYLIENEGRDPSNITLGGDSAGGNMTLSVLSHLSHPHPEIPPLNLSSKLHAALLISPWCSFNTHTPSFDTNAEKDMFDGRPLNRWSGAFLASSSPFAGDFYSEPVLAPASWWETTADVVGEVLVWGGANEVLIDGIDEFAKRFTKGFGGKGGSVQVVITPRACHIEPVVEKLLGYKNGAGTDAAQQITNWARAKL